MKAQAFTLYVNSNMLLCSVLFLPWAMPRETISGLLGRWKATERGWKRVLSVGGAAVVDRIYFWEPDHCVEIFRQERDMRKLLYKHLP